MNSPDARAVENNENSASKLLWAPRPVSLNFRLGRVHFFSKTFPAQELIHHFSRPDSYPHPPLPPSEFLASGAAMIPALPVEKKLRALTFIPHMIRYVPAHYRRFSVELRGTFEEYLAHFSGKSRNTLARKVRKFAGGTAAPCWREYRSPEELEEFRKLAVEVSKRSWQGKFAGTGFPEGPEFLGEFSDRLARDGLRGYILFHQQKPAAYAYCEVEEGALVLGYLGFDLEFERWSPGTVLLYLVIRKLFEDRTFSVLDLGGREDWYKEFFSTRSTLCADLIYFRRGARIFLLLLLHLGMTLLNRLAARTMEAVGLKARVRRLLRRNIPAQARAGDERTLGF